MPDLPASRATDPDTGSEDGPAPDHALSLTVDTHPGGDGGHDPGDPPPAPRAFAFDASGADPGGDGGTSGVGTDDDPGGDGGNQGGGTHAALSIGPDLHDLATASGDGGNQGVGTDQDPGGDGGHEQGPTPDDPRTLHDLTVTG